MKNTAQTLLSKQEQEELVRCVQAVEKTTSGEIVPVISTISHEYPRAGSLGGLVLGVVASVALTLALGRNDMWVCMGLFLAFYLIFSRLLDALPGLKRPFIAKREMRDEVEEAAFNAFYRHGLHLTRDRTGILIYVSVFERTVQVLADKGINDRVNPEVWEEVVEMVTEGIRQDRAGEALCRGVKRCGELVTTHFPIKPDDTDELPNLIIEH